MKVVGRQRLKAFCRRHADARSWLEAWLAEAEAARWRTPAEIKVRYARASFLGDGTVVFDVKGNDYRMETRFAWQTGVLVVEWIGTHAQYDRRNRERRKG
jgi:mRNA interferase HigB